MCDLLFDIQLYSDYTRDIHVIVKLYSDPTKSVLDYRYLHVIVIVSSIIELNIEKLSSVLDYECGVHLLVNSI